MRWRILVGVVWLAICVPALAQSPNRVIVRVVDVGAGLCCIVVTPDGHYMVFDAGNYVDHGASAMVALREMIPYGSTIDLMVISHCDADHLAAAPFICEQYHVKEVWRDGFDSGRITWRRMDQAVRQEAATEGCRDLNLQETDIEPGYQVSVGEATVTFLCGFADVPAEWGLRTDGEDRNARSVVVRLDYGDASVLFGGDTVGRHIGDPTTTCIAAESVLVDRADTVSIDVDAVIAPHHGADNASSTAFIEAMSPRYVVFSADSDFEHPRAATARRYLAADVPVENIFRTDRGDNEGGEEWRSTAGAPHDPIGDDDVQLELARSGQIAVDYLERTEHWFSPWAIRAPSVAVGPRFPARNRLPPEIAKWVENDSLWTDDESDLEAHTLERSKPSVTTAGPSVKSCSARYWPRLFWLRSCRRR